MSRGGGWSLDARRIAAAVLPLDVEELRRPREDDGVRAALRVLVAARDHMSAERTATVNALIALLRVVDLGIDARRALTGKQVAEVCRWRTRDEELATTGARAEAVRPAKRVSALDEEIAANTTRMTDLVNASHAAPLLKKTGIGPVTAAICLTAWSHHGRSAPRRRSPAWPASTRSLHRRGTPSATRSTVAVTGASTGPAHRHRHPHDPRPRHPRLRRQTPSRRPHHQRDPPPPQALRRPADLPHPQHRAQPRLTDIEGS